MSVHWFDYILNPELLVQQLDEGKIIEEKFASPSRPAVLKIIGGMIV